MSPRRVLSRPQPLGRPPSRRSGILEAIRARIIGGEWEPGARLPTLLDLSLHYEASFLTVQQAVAQLAEEGFVEARQGRGIFVAPRLPHWHRFAVLLPPIPEDKLENKFQLALERACSLLEQEHEGRFPLWRDLSADPQSEGARQIERLLLTRQLAGLIVPSYRMTPAYAALAEAHRVPVAALHFPQIAQPDHANVGYVWLDFRDFFRKALDRLKEQGCTRVGILAIAGILPGGAMWTQEDLLKECALRGLQTPPHWIQYAAVWGPHFARNLMHLWMTLPPKERPEGLIIADDNIVEDATLGINEAGIRVPHSLKIVAHGNFQAPARSVVPVTWLGYDERELLLGAVDYLREKAAGGSPVRHHPIPARFEEDWKSQSHLIRPALPPVVQAPLRGKPKQIVPR